jgi:hypothetical protein
MGLSSKGVVDRIEGEGIVGVVCDEVVNCSRIAGGSRAHHRFGGTQARRRRPLANVRRCRCVVGGQRSN